MSQTSSRCTKQILSQDPDAGFQCASVAVQIAHLRGCLEGGFDIFALSKCIEIPPAGEVRRDFCLHMAHPGCKGARAFACAGLRWAVRWAVRWAGATLISSSKTASN